MSPPLPPETTGPPSLSLCPPPSAPGALDSSLSSHLLSPVPFPPLMPDPLSSQLHSWQTGSPHLLSSCLIKPRPPPSRSHPPWVGGSRSPGFLAQRFQGPSSHWAPPRGLDPPTPRSIPVPRPQGCFRRAVTTTPTASPPCPFRQTPSPLTSPEKRPQQPSVCPSS